ncbi:MAG: tryptophan--tRNA ligase, partial [Micromonosporaceae bacterium]
TLLLAAGLDENATVAVQSHVPEHTGLHYLLEATTRYGEVHNMIQFKQKATYERRGTRLSLLTYPVLMAADILLYDIDEVPVGDDQSQHVELTRTVATRFNRRYGDTFTLPVAVNPPVAARIMDLADPRRKMEKTNPSRSGVLFLLDPPDVLRRKIGRAVTDTGTTVAYEPAERPGVANLLDILGVCTGRSPRALAAGFDSYRELKDATGDAVVALLEPLRRRYDDLAEHPSHVQARLRAGAKLAREYAADTLQRANRAIGLLNT